MSDYIAHSQRLDITSLAPDAQRAMAAFSAEANKNFDPKIAELVRIRVSQINGCYFCVDMHTEAAQSAGEIDDRLRAVAVWREAPVFTARERAALSLAESSTRLSALQEVPDDTWTEAAREFSEEELAHLVLIIAAINSWNRIAVPSRKQRG